MEVYYDRLNYQDIRTNNWFGIADDITCPQQLLHKPVYFTTSTTDITDRVFRYVWVAPNEKPVDYVYEGLLTP